jgi:hypothetical protein
MFVRDIRVENVKHDMQVDLPVQKDSKDAIHKPTINLIGRVTYR